MAMHSNWNPWHGCRKCSEGCQNCYVYYASNFDHDGQYKAYREFPSGELYYKPFKGRCIDRLMRTYGDRPEDFCHAMRRLGAVELLEADVACELEVFENLYIRFLLWERDDEYPPSCQILFSSNFPAAFSTYDLVEIVEVILRAANRN
ncbi:MAG: DUF5131 family protein [Eubacteriales bacterium]